MNPGDTQVFRYNPGTLNQLVTGIVADMHCDGRHVLRWQATIGTKRREANAGAVVVSTYSFVTRTFLSSVQTSWSNGFGDISIATKCLSPRSDFWTRALRQIQSLVVKAS